MYENKNKKKTEKINNKLGALAFFPTKKYVLKLKKMMSLFL